MAIIVSHNNQDAKRLDEAHFDLEDNLQEYIYNNPDVVPVYDINENARLFIAAREFSTTNGSIDALGFDGAGNIYVVETKLFKNADKRLVVAQALDYGASLWRNSADFDEFIAQLNSHTQKQFDISFKGAYENFFDIDDAADLLDAIKGNLTAGIIKFVVLMDRLEDRLKDLIVYVNQNSKFDIYAVDFEYYKHEEFEVVIPKLYGAEVKKDAGVSKTTSTRQKWNEERFVDTFKDDLSGDSLIATQKLYNWAKQHADSITYGTGTITGSLNPRFNHISPRSFVHILTSGIVQVSYGYLPNIDLQKSLRDCLAQHIKVVGITDIRDDKLPHSTWLQISPEYVAEHVDSMIDALDQFTNSGVRDGN
ncbi:MAG: hypothetical protein WAS27_00995 [Candidatus Saccharimonadales bacterium]